MISQSIINKAVEECKKSLHHQKHGAVIFKGKRIYSTGFNEPSRSVKSLNPTAAKWKTSIHAEVAAIINAKRDISGLDILVIRMSNKNQFMLSKPCKHCQDYLKYAGIRNIYYSTIEYPFMEKLQ
jgi:deoxycytidylate deaminase